MSELLLLIAFWPSDVHQVKSIKHVFGGAGYVLLPQDAVAYNQFMFQTQQRSADFGGPPGQVWKLVREREAVNSAKAPTDLEDLLRAVRRETGPLKSMSMVFPTDGEHAGHYRQSFQHFCKGEAEALSEFYHALRASPTNAEDVATGIISLIKNNRESEARELLGIGTPLHARTPEFWVAQAHFELEYGSVERAIRKLEAALEKRPLDQMAQATLARAYRTAGDEEAAKRIIMKLHAQGL